MSWKKVVLSLVLVDFAALTIYAVYTTGYVGFFEMLMANWATIAVSADLVIALSLIGVWMWRDAHRRGVSPLPYLVLTATLGSVGPLLYLIRRDEEESPAAIPLGVRGVG